MARHAAPKERNHRGLVAAAAVVTTGSIPIISSPASAATADEWERVAQCESAGLWNRPDGHADSTGGLQIQDRTWADFGGTAIAPHAYQATKEQQIMIAEKILAVQGPRAWSVTWNGTCPGATLSNTPYSPPAAPPAEKPGRDPEPVVTEPEDAEDGVYTVRRGDCLTGIARKLNVVGGWKNLYNINRRAIGANPALIRVGMKLRLPGHEEVVPAPGKGAGTYVVRPGDYLVKIAKANGTTWVKLYDANRRLIGSNPNLIHPGQKLKLPGAVVTEPGQSPPPTPTPPQVQGKVFPIPAVTTTTNPYGAPRASYSLGYHTGVDFTAPQGTPVGAAMRGTVVASDPSGSYGINVQIKHNDGTYTLYAHLSASAVTPGMQVNAGDLVGRVGSTGNSTGPHLHFEVRTAPRFAAGNFINPLAWLRS